MASHLPENETKFHTVCKSPQPWLTAGLPVSCPITLPLPHRALHQACSHAAALHFLFLPPGPLLTGCPSTWLILYLLQVPAQGVPIREVFHVYSMMEKPHPLSSFTLSHFILLYFSSQYIFSFDLYFCYCCSLSLSAYEKASSIRIGFCFVHCWIVIMRAVPGTQ